MSEWINLVKAFRALCLLPTAYCLLFIGCNPTSKNEQNRSEDSVAIADGKLLFNRDCSGCHNFTNDGIGPHLAGVVGEVSAEWLRGFIKNPQSVISSGDDRASALFASYRAVMPSFAHYTEEDLGNIIAYLSTKKDAPAEHNERHPDALDDPIPQAIPISDIVVSLEEFVQIPSSGGPPLTTRITKMDYRPDTKDLFILDLRGKLYRLDNDQPKVYMNMAELRPDFIDTPGMGTGFGSFAFHPEFARNGLLYTTHTEGPGTDPADFSYEDSLTVTLQWVLTEWKVDNKDALTFSGKGRELLRINMLHRFHGVQEIAFNPVSEPGDEDYGLLYIGIGDGGSVEMGYPFLVHSTSRIWGTIARIDPLGSNSRNGQYGIPASNPFAGGKDPDVLGEIYAYGFRNPHRITWTQGGQMLASNIGHHNIESLYLIQPGHDYGWPVREGSFVMDVPGAGMRSVFSLPPDDSLYGITYPVAEYDHNEGNAICGGFEYRGKEVPQLKGKYIFGDIANGRLFFVGMNAIKPGSRARIHEFQVSINGTAKRFLEIAGDTRVHLRLGRDAAGEMYLFNKQDGKVFRIKG